MNFFKEINHYLLTNHPILWRTKVHYFVLFSLILGNAAAFSLGYFPIKWFGAIDLGFIPVGIWVVIAFGILAWLVSQVRNKIKQYRFRDELLTYLIYVFCTMSLLGNLILFEQTVVHTTARLASVVQIDIDKEILEHTVRNGNGYYIKKPERITYPEDKMVVKMAERYGVQVALNREITTININEISNKVHRIHDSQSAVGMRTKFIRGNVARIYIERIMLFLFMPVFFFLISHTNMISVLNVVVWGVILGVISLGMGFLTGGIFTVFAYMVVLLMAAQEGTNTTRFASLLVAPCTLSLAWLFSAFMFMIVAADEFSLVISLIFTITTTALASAYFIKRYFDPIV